MNYRVQEIKVPLSYTEEDVRQAVLARTGLLKEQLLQCTVIRRSLDARREPRYNLIVEFTAAAPLPANISGLMTAVHSEEIPGPGTLHSGLRPGRLSPLIVGAGPAGLMAALVLAENGLKPVIVEQGDRAETRAKTIHRFLKTGDLDPASNILFGEGGAGLYSDGKLTSRHKDRRTIRRFFTVLAECGAPESILIDAEPHLGSDRLHAIIPRLRDRIISLGGTIRFNAAVSGILIEQGIFKGVVVNGKPVPADYGIIAAGHSARELYRVLAESGTALEQKPFAVGVRLEIPQRIVNRHTFGRYAGTPGLEAASFRLTRKAHGSTRSCYTFCMCPGGEVLPCASTQGMVTSNGMSLSARAGINANAAFLVPVSPGDFSAAPESRHPVLQGCRFQEQIESAAFSAGGGDFSLPASRLTDFLNSSGSSSISPEHSCRRSKPADVGGILPSVVYETLISAIPPMIRNFRGLDADQVTVYAAETRSSSPVRILRDSSTGMSVSTENLFPAGEGAGYAGGIVSSALDGMAAAAALMKKYQSD
ncbi:FAD-binding protein [bacterium]|nr:FAD-binding protein [bacterium]